MITIMFSQCSRLELDTWDKDIHLLPLNKRIKKYQNILTTNDEYLFRTYDEHLILVAQQLVREGKLRPGVKVKLVSVCHCEQISEGILEESGDLPDNLKFHHGYFCQRLELLR